MVKLKIIHEKELSGDPINEIILLPESLNNILVHTRDNCIRKVNYERERVSQAQS